MKIKLLLCISLSAAITGFSQAKRNGLFLHAIGISSGYQDAFDSGNNPDGYYSLFYRMPLYDEARAAYPVFPEMSWNRTPVIRLSAELGMSAFSRSRFVFGVSYRGYTHGRFKLLTDNSVFLGYYGTPSGPASYNGYKIDQEHYSFDYTYTSVMCDIGYQFHFIRQKQFSLFAGVSVAAGKTIGGKAYISYEKTDGQLYVLTPGQNLPYEPEPYYDYLDSYYANNTANRNEFIFRASVPVGVNWHPFKKAERLGFSLTGNTGASMLYKNGLKPVADLFYSAQLGVQWQFGKKITPSDVSAPVTVPPAGR